MRRSASGQVKAMSDRSARPEAPTATAAAAAWLASTAGASQPADRPLVPRHVPRSVRSDRRRIHLGGLLQHRLGAPKRPRGDRHGILRGIPGRSLRPNSEGMIALPTIVYCASCGTAIGLVALGALAVNIALLLILVVMAGVCAVHETRIRKQRK